MASRDQSPSTNGVREPANVVWEATALWRRGMMHAVERIDWIVRPGDPLPKGRAAVEMIERIRIALDELADLQRRNSPTNYSDAFALCAADLRAATASPAERRGTGPGMNTSEKASAQ